jgi:membrane protease subunit HflK
LSYNQGGYRGPGEFRHDDIATQLLNALKGRPGLIIGIIWGVIVLGVLIWALATMFYTVDLQEGAVILRFGQYDKSAGVIGPGLHVKAPFGIDRVIKEKVEEVKKAEFGYETIRPGETSEYRVVSSLMLTGDLNVANVRWMVEYKIRDLPDYLFNLRDVDTVVRDLSNAAMRRIVGDHSVDEVLTIGRKDVQLAVEDELQQKLDDYGAGVRVVAVRLRDSTPPDEVRDAFNEVNRALQEKQRVIQEAEGEVNKQIPQAEGQKERTVAEAEGYKIQTVNRAQGDVSEFNAVLEKYRNAPEITRQRLYLETLEKVLPKAGKKYVIQGEGNVLKLLPLEEGLMKGGAK